MFSLPHSGQPSATRLREAEAYVLGCTAGVVVGYVEHLTGWPRSVCVAFICSLLSDRRCPAVRERKHWTPGAPHPNKGRKLPPRSKEHKARLKESGARYWAGPGRSRRKQGASA